MAFQTAYQAEQKLTWLLATKPMTGYLLGLKGAIEPITQIKATQENIIPPTLYTQNIYSQHEGPY